MSVAPKEQPRVEGDVGPARRVRIAGRDVFMHGLQRPPLGDLYHLCMGVSWPAFLAGAAVLYLCVNTLFATVYWLGGQPIANARPGFEDLFYFSIETLATVGYGDMHPQTRYGHMVATVEIFTGMAILAVLTGLVFARFSRPRARVLFADAPIIGRYDGKPTLMLRMANQRSAMIAGAVAKLWVTRMEQTVEGAKIRRVRELALERPENPMFALSWTIFHVIDETSPLAGANVASLEADQSSFVITFTGVDETSGALMHTRQVYAGETLRWDHVYVDIIEVDDSGRTHINYHRFHDTLSQPR